MLILVPAAGASARMRGADKLLEEVDGLPMVVRQVRVALASGANVAVTLPPDRPERADALARPDCSKAHLITVEDASEGMSASIRAGAALATEMNALALMILPADMPEIETQDIAEIMARFDGTTPLRACDEDGTPGHPVVFPARLFERLHQVTGDTGGRDILRDETVATLRLGGQKATTDLDTPEAWRDWRAKTGR